MHGLGAERLSLGLHIACGLCSIGVVSHRVRLLAAALCANKYLDIRINNRVGWLNQLEPQVPTAATAMCGGRRLDKVTHTISFRSTWFKKTRTHDHAGDASGGRAFLPDAGSGGAGGWDVRRAFVKIKTYYCRYLCIVCNALDVA